jgi:hypothetical protein
MATEIIGAEDRNLKKGTLWLIENANEIIREYQAQGFTLTLRQLYYQFIARGILDHKGEVLPNSQKTYSKIGNAISTGRMAGYIDWEAIEDRTRGVEIRSRWASPREILKSARASYHIDMWQNQTQRVEVWIEKEALVGVIESVCRQWDVPYLACRGYLSQSEQWRAYHRIRGYAEDDVGTTILHFGDHDPSGIDMTRDNRDRLETFLNYGDASFPLGEFVTVKRLALNMDQVRQYNPPENPAKMTDSRFDGYAAKFGNKSWELDALEPRVLHTLIEENIQEHIDAKAWRERLTQLKAEQGLLDTLIAGLPE